MLSGGHPRLVARITGKNIIAQIVEYAPAGDKVLVSANSKELSALGWKYSSKNTPAAYLMGYLIATKAKKKGVAEAVFDIGLRRSTSKGKIFAVLKGAVDAGLDIPHSPEVFPSEERISGNHIASFDPKDSGSKQQFSNYSKVSADPKRMADEFAKVKAKMK